MSMVTIRAHQRVRHAAELAHQAHTAQLPPDEWAKRLWHMAVEMAQASVLSIDDALDAILGLIERANYIAARHAEIAIALSGFIDSVPTMEPMKPQPRKFRGKQLKKWPYGGHW